MRKWKIEALPKFAYLTVAELVIRLQEHIEATIAEVCVQAYKGISKHSFTEVAMIKCRI